MSFVEETDKNVINWWVAIEFGGQGWCQNNLHDWNIFIYKNKLRNTYWGLELKDFDVLYFEGIQNLAH